MSTTPDWFAQAREQLTISDAWRLLGFEGEPKASCRSPFREDRSPSFSIFDDGRAWKDHTTGEGGDVVEFLKAALGGYTEARNWLKGRSSIPFAPQPPQKPKEDLPKKIGWPAGIMDSNAGWSAFLHRRKISSPAAHAMVKAGVLRFCKIDGHDCYIVTDRTWRAAEIRRVDGGNFGPSKAFPLRGVDKRWLPGLEPLYSALRATSVLLTEGATDLLSGMDLYSRYRRSGGTHSWGVAAVLGAGCKNLHPDAIPLLRGRHVRIVPDADQAGDQMADHWTGLLRKIGCSVDVVNLTKGSDLSDSLHQISPSDLFTR
jgi:hypothetical protein